MPRNQQFYETQGIYYGYSLHVSNAFYIKKHATVKRGEYQ